LLYLILLLHLLHNFEHFTLQFISHLFVILEFELVKPIISSFTGINACSKLIIKILPSKVLLYLYIYLLYLILHFQAEKKEYSKVFILTFIELFEDCEQVSQLLTNLFIFFV